MARITSPLTNTEISQSKPKEKEYNLADGNGLMLRIKPNGSKLWLFNYTRPYTKKRANISFGSYPELSLKDARNKRTQARELLAQNIDPQEHRDETLKSAKEASRNTLKHLVTEWLEVKKTSVSADHAHDILRSFELHIFPSLGKHPIHKLDAPTVISVLKPVSAKSLETVKRLCQRINEVMIFATNTGVIHHNPLSGISKAFAAPIKKPFASIPPNDLPLLMKRLTTANITLTTRCQIEWSLHTMVRPSEAAGAHWDEIDTASAQWVIPAERMKKKRPHIVPLTKQTLALLEIMRPLRQLGGYIFPARGTPKGHICSATANTAISRMGYKNLLVAHGLRSIASTAQNEEGFDPDLVETSLSHVDKNETRSAYNRADYLERRKVLMIWWSNYIEKAATGTMSLASSGQGIRIED